MTFFVRNGKVAIKKNNVVGCRILGNVTFCDECLHGKKPVCKFIKNVLLNERKHRKVEVNVKKKKDLGLYNRAFA